MHPPPPSPTTHVLAPSYATDIYIYIYIYICVCVCVCVYVCGCVCVYVCVCIYVCVCVLLIFHLSQFRTLITNLDITVFSKETLNLLNSHGYLESIFVLQTEAIMCLRCTTHNSSSQVEQIESKQLIRYKRKYELKQVNYFLQFAM